MKGEIIYRVLTSLGNVALDQADFINAYIRAGYGATSRKIKYELSKINNKRTLAKLDTEKIKKLRNYFYQLKSQGLILENESNKIYLSGKGKDKLDKLHDLVSINRNFYKKKSGEKVIVISYDVPVAFNKERNILRDLLRRLGFDLVHKSVWIGKVKLPNRFVSDLNKLGILDYVEVLEVTRNGTLKSKY